MSVAVDGSNTGRVVRIHCPRNRCCRRTRPRRRGSGAPAPAKAAVAAPPSEAQQYCSSIAAAAIDAQAAWQATRLIELDQQLKQRVAELEAKRAEYKDWLAKREEALRKAEDGLVAIYSRMRPDAAALQLSAMEDGTAAAVLTKLNSRSASAILNEMEAGRAARLTGAMAGVVTTGRDGKKS